MPTWWNWGFVIGLSSLFVTAIGLYFSWWLTRKALSFDYSATPISGLDEDPSGELKLTFRNRIVNDATLVNIKFRNSGSKTIQRKDYEGEIRILVTCAEILWVGPPKGNRNSMEPKIKTIYKAENILVLDPLMLNAGDEITFPFLAHGYQRIAIQGRISGVREIKRKSLELRVSTLKKSVQIIAETSGTALFGFLAYTMKHSSPGLSGALVGLAASVFGIQLARLSSLIREAIQ